MPALSFTRFPALLALISQLAGILSAWLLLWLLARLAGWTATPMLAAGLQGLLAALIGQRLGLPRWWLPINLCFIPGLGLPQGHTLPPWLLLCGFAVLLLLAWSALLERVPLYLTGSAAEQELHRRLDRLPAGVRFIDLGSGLGGPLLRLARAFPQGHFVGVASAPLAFLVRRVPCLLQPNCHGYLRNVWPELSRKGISSASKALRARSSCAAYAACCSPTATCICATSGVSRWLRTMWFTASCPRRPCRLYGTRPAPKCAPTRC